MARAITTAEQLLRASDLGRCELLRGELVRMIPAGGEHGRVVARLTVAIGTHVSAHGLGIAYGAETGFVLARRPDTVRAPDVAFVAAGRAPTVHRGGFLEGAPDLAVEVLSPDDRPRYIREKVAEWLGAGASAVWVVDPRSRTVKVHGARQEPTLLRETDRLLGGEILPGFAMTVSDVFA